MDIGWRRDKNGWTKQDRNVRYCTTMFTEKRGWPIYISRCRNM